MPAVGPVHAVVDGRMAMTAGDSTSPNPQPDTTSPRRSTHRMPDAGQVRERFAERPEVADWILAVREELVSVFGEVGTLSKFANVVKAKRPTCSKTVEQLRRRASEQLTKSPGPSSKLAQYVLAFVVTDDRRAEVTQRFAELYAATRGEPAPFAATTARPEPAPAPVETISAGSHTTGELRDLVTQLRQMIRIAVLVVIPGNRLHSRSGADAFTYVRYSRLCAAHVPA
jgi:hypothetical protein